jgi:hypothetical protein
MNRKVTGQGSRPDLPQESFWLSRAAQARAGAGEAQPTPEPRHSLRCALGLEVVVNFGLTYSAMWHARDFSMTGAFIEMDTAQLQKGESVEVVLRYRYNDAWIEQRLGATVTRIAPDGAALTFGRYDDQTYTDLANLLYAD